MVTTDLIILSGSGECSKRIIWKFTIIFIVRWKAEQIGIVEIGEPFDIYQISVQIHNRGPFTKIDVIFIWDDLSKYN